MPGRDGTGPMGQGPGTGRGKYGSASGGRMGRMGGTRQGAGPDGQCVCPKCGAKTEHKAAMPCYSVKCPECGAQMVRT